MTKKERIKTTGERLIQYLDNYFEKRSKPLTEGEYEQYKEISKREYEKEVEREMQKQ